jgi:hypothetical protein
VDLGQVLNLTRNYLFRFLSIRAQICSLPFATHIQIFSFRKTPLEIQETSRCSHRKGSNFAISARTHPSTTISLARDSRKMDTDDVSDIGQYTQFLDAQKAILKAAMAREGQLPTDRKARDELIDKHQMVTMQTMMQRFGQKEFQIHSSFLPLPYPPSTASLDDLTPVYIKDLRLGIHHRGNYLLVRSVTAPNRMTAIMVVVEDEKRDALVVQLYQQPDENVRPASSIITKGDVFLIKEPFFKIMGDGESGLRIDHVSDLVRIDARHKLWPKQWTPNLFNLRRTADYWKQEGNAAMGRKQYLEAIQRY